MARLLRIDSSARHAGSHSRGLADYFEATWRRRHLDAEVVRRDLASDPIPHINAATIAGFYTSDDQHTAESRAATQLSDALIAELLSADAILLSVPIYNFSIPSALKAYFDQIVRIGRTFGYDPERGLFGTVANRPVYIATVYGASGYVGGALRAYDHLEPYLRSLFGFLGLADLTFFPVQGTSIDPAQAERDRAAAHSAIDGALLSVAA